MSSTPLWMQGSLRPQRSSHNKDNTVAAGLSWPWLELCSYFTFLNYMKKKWNSFQKKLSGGGNEARQCGVKGCEVAPLFTCKQMFRLLSVFFSLPQLIRWLPQTCAKQIFLLTAPFCAAFKSAFLPALVSASSALHASTAVHTNVWKQKRNKLEKKWSCEDLCFHPTPREHARRPLDESGNLLGLSVTLTSSHPGETPISPRPDL